MGVFEFIILLVLISTLGKILSGRRRYVPPPREGPQLPPGEVREIREALEQMEERLGRIEEERDFYRKLLEDPRRREGPPEPPGDASTGG